VKLVVSVMQGKLQKKWLNGSDMDNSDDSEPEAEDTSTLDQNCEESDEVENEEVRTDTCKEQGDFFDHIGLFILKYQHCYAVFMQIVR